MVRIHVNILEIVITNSPFSITHCLLLWLNWNCFPLEATSFKAFLLRGFGVPFPLLWICWLGRKASKLLISICFPNLAKLCKRFTFRISLVVLETHWLGLSICDEHAANPVSRTTFPEVLTLHLGGSAQGYRLSKSPTYSGIGGLGLKN